MDSIAKKLEKAHDFVKQGFYKQAEIFYLEYLDKSDQQDLESYKKALHGLGLVKIELSQYTEATELFSALLRIAKDEGNKEEEAIVLHQMGITQHKARNYQEALSLFEQEREIYDRLIPDFHLGYAANLYESGTIYMLQDDLKAAEETLKKAVSHAEKAGDLIVIGHAYRNLGDVYQATNEPQKAMVFYQSALESFHRGNENERMEEVKGRMIGILQDMDGGSGFH